MSFGCPVRGENDAFGSVISCESGAFTGNLNGSRRNSSGCRRLLAQSMAVGIIDLLGSLLAAGFVPLLHELVKVVDGLFTDDDLGEAFH